MKPHILALAFLFAIAGFAGTAQATGHFDSSDQLPDWAKCAYDTKYSNYC